jgi:hypothetical protein
MTSAKTKQVAIRGVSDVDKLLKLDISTYPGGGNVGYQDTNTKADKNIDDKVTIQGIDGVVSKTGTMASRSGVGSLVSANLGNINGKKAVSIVESVDDATYKPYLLSDIVAEVAKKAGVTIELKGYDLLIEDYFFTGTLTDCLNDLAGLIYGTVEYISTDNKYVIKGGDYTDKLSSSGTGLISIEEDDIISWEVVTEKNSNLRSFGSDLINIAKELARLRAAILEIEPQKSVSNIQAKELQDVVSFEFGYKGGYVPIPSYVEVDSIHWDEWYFDAQGFKYSNSTGDAKFISKYTKYFKEETLLECITEPTSTGSTGVVSRGKKRGLKSIGIGTTLQFRLKNTSINSSCYGRGYLTNLTSLGLPSVTKYREDASKASTSKTPYDDCYHTLYDIVVKKVIVKESETSDRTVDDYVPFLEFRLAPALYNDVQAALKAKKSAAGDYTDPTDYEINDTLLMHQYGAKVEIVGSTVTTQLIYKGWLDKYGRLITDSGQVVLIYTTASGNNTSGTSGFYGPLEGMDLSFTPAPQKTPVPGQTPATSLIDDYFDESVITSKLISAYADLKALCGAQPQIGMYDPKAGTGYPKFIYETLPNPTQSGLQIGALIGVVYGEKEYTDTLTLSTYTSVDKQRKQLERKVKCVESKIALIIKCIVKLDPSSKVSKSTVTDLLKIIIKYQTILAKVKTESLATMVGMRTEYETALNDILAQFNCSSNAKINRATVTIILPDSLPNINDTMILPATVTKLTGFKVVSTSVSGVTATIVGEYNA